MEDQVHEKIGQLIAKADAAHARIDKLEILIRDDLKEMKADVKDLSAYMHRGKGWAAAALFVASISGAGIMKLLMVMFEK